MSTLRFLTGLALVVCLTAACGDGDGGGGSNDQSGQQANRPEAPGAPGGGGGYGGDGGSGGKVAPVSPIKVPHITESGFLLGPPHNVRGRIEDEIRSRCGGTLCVKLVEEARFPEMTKCQFFKLEPEVDTVVDRESTITIVTGTKPCGDELGPAEPDSPPVEPTETVSPS